MSDAPPRIFYVEYKSAVNGRVARFFVKIPYGVWRDSLYGLNECFARAVFLGLISRFRVDVARPGQITPDIRSRLTRWPEALAATTNRTKVEWA
jgi:hypothetical protein